MMLEEAPEVRSGASPDFLGDRKGLRSRVLCYALRLRDWKMWMRPLTVTMAGRLLPIKRDEVSSDEDCMGSAGLEEKIKNLLADAENFEVDEPLPSPNTVQQAVKTLEEVERIAGRLPDGFVNGFYGELSITWTLGHKQVRLMFSDKAPPKLYWENTARKLYDIEAASPTQIAQQLKWLTSQEMAYAH